MIAGLRKVDVHKSEELGPEHSSKSSDSKSVHELSDSERRLSFSQSEEDSQDSVISDQLQEELKEEL